MSDAMTSTNANLFIVDLPIADRRTDILTRPTAAHCLPCSCALHGATSFFYIPLTKRQLPHRQRWTKPVARLPSSYRASSTCSSSARTRTHPSCLPRGPYRSHIEQSSILTRTHPKPASSSPSSPRVGVARRRPPSDPPTTRLSSKPSPREHTNTIHQSNAPATRHLRASSPPPRSRWPRSRQST